MTAVARPAGAGAGTGPARPPRPLWRRVLGPLLSLALVGGVFFWFLPQFTSVADVWDSVRAMSWVEVSDPR